MRNHHLSRKSRPRVRQTHGKVGMQLIERTAERAYKSILRSGVTIRAERLNVQAKEFHMLSEHRPRMIAQESEGVWFYVDN